MPNDYRIDIDPGLAKIIGETICKEITDSRNANQKIYDRSKRNENLYNQITYWMDIGKQCDDPWEGAADYFVPLTEWIIDAVWARVLSIIFGEQPYMTAKGVEASDVDKEEGVTDFVDMAHNEIVHLYENFKFFVKQMLKLPFAVIKYPWVTDNERIIVKEKALTFMDPKGGEPQYLPQDDSQNTMIQGLQLEANGWQFGGEQEVFVLQEKQTHNAPQLQYITFDDYVWSPSAKKNHRLYWEGDRFWLTINELQEKVHGQDFIEEAVRKLRNTINPEGMSAADFAIKVRGTLFECYNWYGRFPFNANNQIDFVDPEAIEQEVHAVVSMKEKELLMLNHWEYSRRPTIEDPERVYIHGMFEETESFEGRSLVDKLYMTQKELNTLHNTTMNNALLIMQKVIVKKRTLQGEEWEKPEIYPGAIWEEDMQGDIHVLDMGDLKAVAWEMEASFINFAERISNISIYQTGTARQGGNKTKGEVERTVYEGNIGMDKFIERCNLILKKITQWTVDYYHERMPPGLERRIRGEGGEMIFPTQDNMGIYQERGVNPYWESDDLAGKYDFRWEGTSLNRSKEWKIQVANDLMEHYLPQPMIAGSLIATWDILKRGLIARGIKDWQNILPTKEAVIQEMQRMELESQARDAQTRTEKNTPSEGVKKAVEAGVPEEVAVKIAQGGNA